MKSPVSNNKSSILVVPFLLLLYINFSSCKPQSLKKEATPKAALHKAVVEVNHDEIKNGNKTIAIVDVTLIDGVADKAISNSTIIIKNGVISDIGSHDIVQIPHESIIVQGAGLTLMPGLIDAHFHYDYVENLPTKFVRNGVTSIRDPGQWVAAYAKERERGTPMPRLFLTGPHLDSPPAAYPIDSYTVRDKAEVQEAMKYLIDVEGASGVKVYFRLPLGLIKEVCEIAHDAGLPVTGHLEIVDARQAILAGLDGIEHVTSLGTALISTREAEAYRQSVMADNNARKQGRYKIWKDIDLTSNSTNNLIDFLVEHQTFLTPTLGPFEYRIEANRQDSTSLLGFQNMMKFIGLCHLKGVRIVVGSHGPGIRYAKNDLSYQHEMWLLSQTGMDNMSIIKAATIENAKFLRIDKRLGTITKGKQADLLLINGDPLTDITNMHNINRVMLNGKWIE